MGAETNQGMGWGSMGEQATEALEWQLLGHGVIPKLTHKSLRDYRI